MSSAIPPQNGSVTHHHDQLIIFNNLRTTKTTPNKPTVEIPLLDELSDMICLFLFECIRIVIYAIII